MMNLDLTTVGLTGRPSTTRCSSGASSRQGAPRDQARPDAAHGLRSPAGWTCPARRSRSVNFKDADLTLAKLDKATAARALFVGAKAQGASFRGATLSQSIFLQADLTGADLSEARADQCILTKATCTGARFTGADLTYADFTHADVSDADFSKATLFRARFHQTKEERAILRLPRRRARRRRAAGGRRAVDTETLTRTHEEDPMKILLAFLPGILLVAAGVGSALYSRVSIENAVTAQGKVRARLQARPAGQQRHSEQSCVSVSFPNRRREDKDPRDRRVLDALPVRGRCRHGAVQRARSGAGEAQRGLLRRAIPRLCSSSSSAPSGSRSPRSCFVATSSGEGQEAGAHRAVAEQRARSQRSAGAHRNEREP